MLAGSQSQQRVTPPVSPEAKLHRSTSLHKLEHKLIKAGLS